MQNPLPVTIKLMIVNELVVTLSNAEAKEMDALKLKMKTKPTEEEKKES